MFNPQQDLANAQMNKINYFCFKLGINDYQRAERYLNEADWNEELAVQNFINKHRNIPNNNFNQNHVESRNNQQLNPPLNEINVENKLQKQNEIKNDYLEFYIGESLLKNINNNGSFSESLNQISISLNSVEKTFGNFLKLLKKKIGIIIMYSKESFNSLKEQIDIIKKDILNKELLTNCVIFPCLNTSPIGIEFIQQLSCISFPVYIFCKYKDNKNFYITGRIEGAFNISSFNNFILKNIPDSKSNPVIIKNSYQNENIEKNVNDNKKSNNLIRELKNAKYFDIKNLQNRKIIINNNNNINNNKKNEISQKTNIKIKKENNEEKKENEDSNNNFSLFDSKNYGDYFLGNSQEIENLFSNNNQNDNRMNLNNNNNNNPLNPNYLNNNFNNYNYPPNYNYINNGFYNNQFYNYNNYLNNNFQYQYPIINPNININNNLGMNNNDHDNNHNNSLNNNKKKENSNKKDDILADSIYGLSDAQVLEKRKEEMEKLEIEQEEKEKEEEKEKDRIKELNDKYEQEVEIAKMNLPEEPDKNNKDICCIIFRLPDGEKNIERRFLKTDKIEILYNYIKSIGRDIFEEPNSRDFDILSPGFPPKNLESKKNNTLEQEGLFPNSLLQIKEKQI